MQIGKPWIALFAAVLLGCLITIAFLLGRESARPPPAPPIAQAPPVEAPPPVERAAAPPPLPTDGDAPRPLREREPREVEAPPPAVAPPPARSLPAPAGQGAVAAYFAQVDALEAGAQVADPDAFARALLASSMSGDNSAVDELVRNVRALKDRARALSPPPECASYHRSMLDMVDQAERLLGELAGALKTKDASALVAASEGAHALQAKVQSMEAERARLLAASRQAVSR